MESPPPAIQLQNPHGEEIVDFDPGTWLSSPVPMAFLEVAGREARLNSGGVDRYELEIDEPQTTCNLFSRRRNFVAQYPEP